MSDRLPFVIQECRQRQKPFILVCGIFLCWWGQGTENEEQRELLEGAPFCIIKKRKGKPMERISGVKALNTIDGEITPEYQVFVDKFKPKLTTDDCYTPPVVYEAVADWTAKAYGLDKASFVRPFWPGGDYQRETYPPGCVVVDNPPFSIMEEIVPWYCQRGIRFLLFNQKTTGMKGYGIANRCTVLATECSVTYANGAVVPTSFITNLESKYIIRSAPDLQKALEDANKENLKSIRKTHPKYVYPWNVVTCAMVSKYSKYGVEYGVPYGEGTRIHTLDSQRSAKKTIFGGGLLVSERAAAERAAAERAAERAAAERAAAIVWQLSDREREIIRQLSSCKDLQSGQES